MGGGRFRRHRENLLKTLEIIYFKIRDLVLSCWDFWETGALRGAARTGGFGCGGIAVFAVIRGVPGCNSSGSVFPVVAGC